MNDKINFELNFYKNKRMSLKVNPQIKKETILKYLKNFNDNFQKEEIKKSIIEAFIDCIIIYENEVGIKQIPMDKVGGDDGN